LGRKMFDLKAFSTLIIFFISFKICSSSDVQELFKKICDSCREFFFLNGRLLPKTVNYELGTTKMSVSLLMNRFVPLLQSGEKKRMVKISMVISFLYKKCNFCHG
jgi:hypothetical protein